MKRASRIMMTVGIVLSYVGMASLILCGIAFLVCSLPPVIAAIRDAVVEGVKNGTIHSDLTPEQAGDLVMGLWLGYFVTGTVLCFIFAVIYLLTGIFTAKAKREEQKKGYIITIVFGALSGLYFLIAAGILGIIAKNKEENNKVVEEAK